MLVDLLSNFLLLFLLSGSDGLPDGLHPTPPMGWTSWNTFFENNTEEKMISQVWQLIHDQMLWENVMYKIHFCYGQFSDTFSNIKVDALISLGLDTFGYDTLTIDDFWQLPERDSAGKWVFVLNAKSFELSRMVVLWKFCNGLKSTTIQTRMVPDPEKFPNGIKYLADYFHERLVMVTFTKIIERSFLYHYNHCISNCQPDDDPGASVWESTAAREDLPARGTCRDRSAMRGQWLRRCCHGCRCHHRHHRHYHFLHNSLKCIVNDSSLREDVASLLEWEIDYFKYQNFDKNQTNMLLPI